VNTVAVVVTMAGFVLIWAGIKNKHPLQAVQIALQGGDPNTARPLYTPAGLGAGAVPSQSLPGTPQADSDARTDPPGFTPGPNVGVVPILPGESAPGGGGGVY
jgi:hypothetical protein